MTPEKAYARIEVLHGDKVQMIKDDVDSGTELPDEVFGKESALRDTLDILKGVVDIDDVPDASTLGEDMNQASQLQMVSRHARSGELTF